MAYSGSQPVSEVVLSFSCRDLLDKDFFSKSDPIVVVQESPDGVKWNEVSEKTQRTLFGTLGTGPCFFKFL